MPNIHEISTITSKGQITLPKAIRQALGVDYGGKVAFEIRGTEVIVSRADVTEHHDPAIAQFLSLIEADIAAGQRLASLPANLGKAMKAASLTALDLNKDIEGDVSL